MKFQTKFQIDLTVKSFDYVARKLSTSPTARYEEILVEAERHRQALRILQRDVIELAQRKLREQALTENASLRARKAVTRGVDQALGAISRIAAQYAQHKLAA